MKRRLTIARALMNDPELILLDEPTTGLDPQARHLVWERLFQLKTAGRHHRAHHPLHGRGRAALRPPRDHGRGPHRRPRARPVAHRAARPREVVELRFPDEHRARRGADTIERHGGRLEALAERILIYTDDGDALVGAPAADGVRPTASWCDAARSRTSS